MERKIRFDELYAFLATECGNLCMDDDQDRSELSERLLEKFNVYLMEETNEG